MKLIESNKEDNIFIAPGAIVLGDVTIGEDVGIWYHATVRGDKAPIVIGKGSNIQDNSVVHVDPTHPVVIGENVTIGHSAVIHGCITEQELAGNLRNAKAYAEEAREMLQL